MRLRNLVIPSLVVLAGCASPSGSGSSDTARPASSPSPPAVTPAATADAGAMPPVTVSRTGGIAGLNDEYNVAPDGAITGSNHTSPTVSKKLTGAQLGELRRLVTTGSLATEAKKSPIGAQGCADGFRYTVKAGAATVSGTDCGGLVTEAPTMWKIVTLVQEAVGQ